MRVFDFKILEARALTKKEGWIVSVKPSDLDKEIKLLMDSKDYYKYLKRLIEERENELKTRI